MTGCFSALFSCDRRTGGRDAAPPRSRAESKPSCHTASPLSHPSCGYCGDWAHDDSLASSVTSTEALPPYVSITAFSSSIIQNLKETIHETIQTTLNEPLRKLSLDIHATPEVGFQEHKTHDILVSFMRQYERDGWKIIPHAFGLETAWSATFEHRASANTPTVGFNSEEDALPGIGHACGHNLIAIGGVAAALSLSTALVKHDIPGKIHLLGTPAEEGGGGKIILLKNGAYRNLSACFMIHPFVASTLGSMIAVVPITVTYKGKSAHAGASPWEGVNAQDAAVLAYNNISALRQQLHPSVRVHGIITATENWAPNVIPSESRLVFNIRTTREKDQLKPVKERVLQCFKAAAIATGCTVEIKEGLTYADVHQQSTLRDLYASYMKDEFKEEFGSAIATASTDFGNITYTVPSLHPLYRIPVASPVNENGNHTPGFTKAAATAEAHKLTLNAAEGIAVLAGKVVSDEEFRRDVWKKWENEIRE